MRNVTERVEEIRSQLQNANLGESSRVIAKFLLSDGWSPVQILPAPPPNRPPAPGADLVRFVMDEIDRNFLAFNKGGLLNIVVDIQ